MKELLSHLIKSYEGLTGLTIKSAKIIKPEPLKLSSPNIILEYVTVEDVTGLLDTGLQLERIVDGPEIKNKEIKELLDVDNILPLLNKMTKEEAINELLDNLYKGAFTSITEETPYNGGIPYVGLVEVSGIRGAMHGMRNPMNSWRLSDTQQTMNTRTLELEATIGANDLRLAQNLIHGGPEHRKFLRQISVTFDMNMPRYIWSEFDTYHHNTKNSTSTMHKLLNVDDTKETWDETALDTLLSTRGAISLDNFFYAKEDEDLMLTVIDKLNTLGKEYFKEGADKKHILRRAKQILPESWLQMRTVTTNYEELRNIYFQRRNHRLNVEWGIVCAFIESLPYAKELILFTKEKKGE